MSDQTFEQIKNHITNQLYTYIRNLDTQLADNIQEVIPNIGETITNITLAKLAGQDVTNDLNQLKAQMANINYTQGAEVSNMTLNFIQNVLAKVIAMTFKSIITERMQGK